MDGMDGWDGWRVEGLVKPRAGPPLKIKKTEDFFYNSWRKTEEKRGFQLQMYVKTLFFEISSIFLIL